MDDGSAESTGDQKNFDIPKPIETPDERKRRLYTEHHVVRTTGTLDFRLISPNILEYTTIEFCFSHKNASTLTEDAIELITKEKPSHVNLAKNKFTEMPIE